VAKSVDRITLQEERQDGLRVMLMWHYEGHLEFIDDSLWLLYWYERLVEALSRATHRYPDVAKHEHVDVAWEALESAINGAPVRTRVAGRRRTHVSGSVYSVRQSRNAHLRRYRDDLVAQCVRWGLRCDWAPAWFHAANLEYVQRLMSGEELAAIWDRLPPGVQAAAIRMGHEPGKGPLRKEIQNRWRRYVQAVDQELPDLPSLVPRRYIDDDWISQRQMTAWREHFSRARFPGGGPASPKIGIEEEYDPWPVDRWQEVEKRILREARRQRDEIRAEYVRAGFVPEKVQPSLAVHIHWLYLAICPQPDAGKPLGWTEITRFKDWGPGYEYLSSSAIQKAVEPLAEELGIDLPDLEPGRPSKY
jgi:hypothetical protein